MVFEGLSGGFKEAVEANSTSILISRPWGYRSRLGNFSGSANIIPDAQSPHNGPAIV